jgi:hypothetical protein
MAKIWKKSGIFLGNSHTWVNFRNHLDYGENWGKTRDRVKTIGKTSVKLTLTRLRKCQSRAFLVPGGPFAHPEPGGGVSRKAAAISRKTAPPWAGDVVSRKSGSGAGSGGLARFFWMDVCGS